MKNRSGASLSMNGKEKKQVASNLFVNTPMNRKQIAEQVGCTEKTLRGWIQKGDWENLKEAETITRPKLLKDAYSQLKALNEHIKENLGNVPNKACSDAKGVIRKEIEALTDMPLHKYVEVGMALTQWIQHNCPQQLTAVMEVFDQFVQHLSSEKNI